MDVDGLICIDLGHHPRYEDWISNYLLPNLKAYDFQDTIVAHYISKQPVLSGINITEYDQFRQYLIDSPIKRWLVAGASWKLCVHTRQVGLRNMSLFYQDPFFVNEGYKFYAAPWSIYDDEENRMITDLDFAEDPFVTWEKDQNLYQLKLCKGAKYWHYGTVT